MSRLNNILIVDDDEMNNLYCKIVIEHTGIAGDVHYCMSGPEAFEYLSSCISNHVPIPDLILLDINMPYMNGFEFLDLFEGLGYDIKAKTKIAMLSSSGLESDIKTAFKYDTVVDYIIKPLSEQALNKVLSKL